jgi:hypothetical protein
VGSDGNKTHPSVAQIIFVSNIFLYPILTRPAADQIAVARRHLADAKEFLREISR